MRRSVTVSFKILVTVALLAFVLFRVDLKGVAAAIGALSGAAITAALGLTFLSVAVSAWRWHRVLDYLGEQVSPWALFGDTLVGTTYNLLLPTSVGGDVARGLRSARRVRDAEHAWASVAYERLLGLLSLAVVSTLGLSYALSDATLPVLVTALLMAVALATLIAIAPAPLRLAARLGAGSSASLATTLRRIAEAWGGALSRPLPRLETFLWSVVYQVVALTILLPIGYDWGITNLPASLYLGVPIVLVAATLPVSLGGHGLRESLFVVVLSPFGVDASHALGLSLVWLASNLTVGIAGLGVIVAGRGRSRGGGGSGGGSGGGGSSGGACGRRILGGETV
ncbi:MAG: flippase-like domain-containing protein [Polyangiaceae bacterium]|nr:flippase-like domain-containing protein [Polyangiaceae bacterium]